MVPIEKEQAEGIRIIKRFEGDTDDPVSVLLVEKGGRVLIYKVADKSVSGAAAEFERTRLARVKAREVLADWGGKINIPKIVETGPGYILEEPAPGEPMTGELIDSFSPAQKEDFAKALAEFLNFMHQVRARKEKSVCPLADDFDGHLLKAYQACLPPKDFQRVKKVFSNARTINRTDEYTVFAHTDLMLKNIFYDRESERVSVIDFGNSGFGHKFRDVTDPYQARDAAMCEIISQMIDIYNGLPKDYPIRYKKYPVWALLEYGAYLGFGVQAACNGRSGKKFAELFEGALKPALLRLDKAFGIASGR